MVRLQDSSDDEEINKLNKAASKIPTYKSIKNLVRKRFYKVLDISDVETTKGRTIRLKLEDGDVNDGACFVHMPRNVLSDMFPMLPLLKEMISTDPGLFFQFRGMKGLAFKIRFSRNPVHKKQS